MTRHGRDPRGAADNRPDAVCCADLAALGKTVEGVLAGFNNVVVFIFKY